MITSTVNMSKLCIITLRCTSRSLHKNDAYKCCQNKKRFSFHAFCIFCWLFCWRYLCRSLVSCSIIIISGPAGNREQFFMEKRSPTASLFIQNCHENWKWDTNNIQWSIDSHTAALSCKCFEKKRPSSYVWFILE